MGERKKIYILMKPGGSDKAGIYNQQITKMEIGGKKRKKKKKNDNLRR